MVVVLVVVVVVRRGGASDLGRNLGDLTGEPGPREAESAHTPRLRLRRLFDLVVGAVASVASSTLDTEEERSRCRRKSGLSPQESAGVVGTEKFPHWMRGTLCWFFARGSEPYWASRLNLAHHRQGM